MTFNTLDKAWPDTYELVLPMIPGQTDIRAGSDLTLNVFGTVLPSISMGETINNWQGHEVSFPGPPIAFGNWTFQYKVDSDFKNYKILFDWMMLMDDNNENVIAGNLDDYAIDATLLIKASFDRPVLKATFNILYPIALGEVTFDASAGDTQLNSDVTFAYWRFELGTF